MTVNLRDWGSRFLSTYLNNSSISGNLSVSGFATSDVRIITKGSNYTLGSDSLVDFQKTVFTSSNNITYTIGANNSATAGRGMSFVVGVANKTMSLTRAGTDVFVDTSGNNYTSVALGGTQGTSVSLLCIETGK